MSAVYSSNRLESNDANVCRAKLRYIISRFSLAPAAKPSKSLPYISPFFGVSYSKLYELAFRTIPRVRISSLDKLLILRGKAAAHRWLAEWHRKRALEEDYLADCEDAGVPADLQRFWREKTEHRQMSFDWSGDKKCQCTEKLPLSIAS